MKKTIVLFLLTISSFIGFSQSRNNQFATSKQLQAQTEEIKSLRSQIDSLSILFDSKVEKIHKECHNDCNNYYDRVDNEFNRMLTKLSVVWGLFGVIMGIILPLIINRSYEQSFHRDISELKEFVTQQLKNQDRITASRLREQYKDIDRQIKEQNKTFGKRFSEHKAYIDKISIEVETYEKQSKINSLISEAQSIPEADAEKSIPIYTNVLALDPNNESALLGRGIAYELTNRFPEALVDLNRLIEINPKHARAYNNIANVYLQSQLYDKALENYNQALVINPQYATVYGNIGLLYETQMKFEKAIENFEKAIALENTTIKFFEDRRRCYVKQLQTATSESDKTKYKSLIESDTQRIKTLQSQKLG